MFVGCGTLATPTVKTMPVAVAKVDTPITKEADVNAKTEQWIKTLCSITPQNSENIISKLATMGELTHITDTFRKIYTEVTVVRQNIAFTNCTLK